MKNIAVKAKLMIGFAIVLVLMAILTLVGIKSLNSMAERSDKLVIINNILDEISEIRAARLSYERRGDEDFIKVLQQSYHNVLQMIQDNRRYFTAQADISSFMDIEQAMQLYHDHFQQMVTAQHEIILIQKGWEQHGDKAESLITELMQTVSTQNDTTLFLELYALADVLSNAQQATLMLSQHMNTKLIEEKNLYYQKLKTMTSHLQLRLQIPARSLLDSITVEMNAYMALTERFIKLNTEQDNYRRLLQDDFKVAFDEVNQFVERQNTLSKTESQQNRYIMLLLLTFAVVAGLTISWLIIRQITEPLQQAVNIANRIGQGELTAVVTDSRTDEFGDLLKALSLTRDSLHDALEQVGLVATQLSASAEQLSAVTEQTSAGVNSQKLETDQVATAMNEMVATVRDVAQNAEEASVAARQADSQANQGNIIAQQAVTQISKMSDDISTTSEAVLFLSKESDRIGGILTVINDIADQTNLLALNAAIEAARAGDAGRGFAVVADEVRGLAQRTQKSTAEIEALISSLQQGSQKATDMMNNSCQMMENTVMLTTQAGTELQSIAKTVTNIQLMNTQIATAAEQQSSVAEEINRSILNVRDIADQSAAASEQTSASAIDLARLSSELQVLLSRFKL